MIVMSFWYTVVWGCFSIFQTVQEEQTCWWIWSAAVFCASADDFACVFKLRVVSVTQKDNNLFSVYSLRHQKRERGFLLTRSASGLSGGSCHLPFARICTSEIIIASEYLILLSCHPLKCPQTQIAWIFSPYFFLNSMPSSTQLPFFPL